MYGSTDYIEQFFGIKDLVVLFILLSFVIGFTVLKTDSMSDKRMSKLYAWNIAHKIFFASLFAVFYIFIVRGGDTLAYWRTSEVLSNLFWKSPTDFFNLLSSDNSWETYLLYFNEEVGRPPSFIFREEESFFVAKVLVIFNNLTFNSYISATVIFSVLMASASWKLFTITSAQNLFSPRLLSLFILFMPSVAFWTAGVSKDGLVFISILYSIYYLYLLFNGLAKRKIRVWLALLFFLFIVYQCRPFILYALFLPIGLMYISNKLNQIKDFQLLRILIKGLTAVGVIIGVVYISLALSNNDLLNQSSALQEASVIQQDFEQNTQTYGDESGKRYSLGDISYTPTGLLRIMPLAVLAGIFRPYPWEALSPSLLFNGIESLIFLYFSFKFLFGNLKKKIQVIRETDFLAFAIGFVFIIAFIAGFSSILFGVLVRIRAPLLPFFGLLLAIDWKTQLESISSRRANYLKSSTGSEVEDGEISIEL